MKSFAFALLSCIVAADLDIEDILRDINDVPREAEKGLEELTEDLECWWADRNNGDGVCQKRTDKKAEDECNKSAHNYIEWYPVHANRPEWNRDAKVCVTVYISCEMDGKSWYSIPTDWGTSEGCDHDGFAVPRYACENDPTLRWDWSNNVCSSEQAICENEGGKFLEITDRRGDVEYVCDRDGFELARRDCSNSYPTDKISGRMTWDWDRNICTTQKDECDSSGKGEGWACLATELISSGFDCFCDYDGKEVQRHECSHAGNYWSWDSDSCNETYKKVMVMARIDAEVDIAALEIIGAPVIQGQEAGQQIFEGLNNAVNEVVDSWSPVIEEWSMKQQQTGEEAARQLQDLILDSVMVDGASLRDLVGDNAPLNMKSKSVRSMVKQVVMQADPTKANVTVYIPDQEELESQLAAFQAKGEALVQRLEDIEREFKPKYEDLNRDLERALENVGEDAEEVVNSIGDFAKNITDSATVEFSLMKAAENNSDSAYMYAGASFGAIGVIAAAALLSTFSKKQTADNQEALL